MNVVLRRYRNSGYKPSDDANLIPGGGGGSGDASVSPPAAPPAPAGGETAGAVTLTAAGSGGALGHGVARSGDTEDIMSVARVADSASETAEVENLQHPANTAENVDNLARLDVEGTGYQQVADIYEQPVPTSAVLEPDGGESVHSRLGTFDGPGHQRGRTGRTAQLRGQSRAQRLGRRRQRWRRSRTPCRSWGRGSGRPRHR